jgi:hypothetical protein
MLQQKTCPTRLHAALAAAITVLGVAGSAHAAVVQITMTGTLENNSNPIFGMSDWHLPFSLSMTYDTSLDTNTVFVPSGTFSNGDFTTAWYGYSVSGITAFSVTIGTFDATSTFPISSLSQSYLPSGGLHAPLFFDTDISATAPTGMTAGFLAPTGELNIHWPGDQQTDVYDYGNPEGDPPVSGSQAVMLDFYSMSWSVVPAPGSTTLLGLGGLTACRRRRRQAYGV